MLVGHVLDGRKRTSTLTLKHVFEALLLSEPPKTEQAAW
jgi:hypothetical protein